jgi:hypothetical protein
METEPSNPLKEIFEELFGLLESLEAQSMAVTQFLKDQKIGNDKKLAPYLEQAGNASSVKWRAARARMEYLLAPVQKEAEEKKKAAEKKESGQKETDQKEVEQNEPEKKEPQPKNQATESARSDTPKRDQPLVNADAKPAKSSDSSDAKPEKKNDSTPEPERK